MAHFNSFFNPLSTNFTKWSNTLKQFVSKLPTDCLSVFEHFMELVLKGLINSCFPSSSINAKQKSWGAPHLLHTCVVLFYFSEVLKVKQLSFFVDHISLSFFVWRCDFFRSVKRLVTFLSKPTLFVYIYNLFIKPIILSSLWIFLWNSLCKGGKNVSLLQAKNVLKTEKHFFHFSM